MDILTKEQFCMWQFRRGNIPLQNLPFKIAPCKIAPCKIAPCKITFTLSPKKRA